MTRDKAAEDAARKAQKELAEKVEKAGKAAIEQAVPAIKGGLGLSYQESKMLEAAIGSLAAVVSGYFSGKWIDSAFKIVGFFGGIFGDEKKDPVAAALASLGRDVSDMRSLLILQYRKEETAALERIAIDIDGLLNQAKEKFKPAQGDVRWFSTFDYQQLDGYTDEAIAIVNELLGVGAADPHYVSSKWLRTFDGEQLSGCPYWRPSPDENDPEGQLFFPLTEPDAPKSPLDGSHPQFDYRLPLTILSKVMPQILAMIRLRDPFYQTTGRYTRLLDAWADALEGNVVREIEECVLRSDYQRLYPFFIPAAGAENLYYATPIPAGAVNAATGEAVYVHWLPGVGVEWDDLRARTLKVHRFDRLSWPWPPPGQPVDDTLDDFTAFARAGYAPFVDTCVNLLRQTLPTTHVRRLTRGLRAAADLPEFSETFGPNPDMTPTPFGSSPFASENGSVSFAGGDYVAQRHATSSIFSLTRPHDRRLGEEPVILLPGTTPRRHGLTIQWPLRSINSNEAMPISYWFSVESNDGTVHPLTANLGERGAILGALTVEQRYAGQLTSVACTTFDWVTGASAPAPRARFGEIDHAVTFTALPAPPVPQSIEVLPEFDEIASERSPNGVRVNARGAVVDINWSMFVSEGEIVLALSAPIGINVGDMRLVIEEARVNREGLAGEPTRVRTTVPLTLSPVRIVVNDPDYWQAVEASEAALLSELQLIWTVIKAPIEPGIVFPGSPEDIPVAIDDLRRVVEAMPFAAQQDALREVLKISPTLHRVIVR